MKTTFMDQSPKVSHVHLESDLTLSLFRVVIDITLIR